MMPSEMVKTIQGMTTLEIRDLVGLLSDQFGVEVCIPALQGAPKNIEPQLKMEEPLPSDCFYAVFLRNYDTTQKIQAIKSLRECVMGLGLKEAKDICDCGMGAEIASGLTLLEASHLMKQLRFRYIVTYIMLK